MTKPLKDLIAIAAPARLLAEMKREALIQKITESCALDTERFNRLCSKLIHNIANYYQLLPESANRYYALPGGLIDHALNRTEAALHLFRQHLLQDQQAELSEEQKLWLYALFSASLLQGIGKLQLDYQINFFDNKGHLLKTWNPLLDKPASTGHYYHYEFTKGSEDDLRHRLNIVLALQLMPESGFSWVASEPDVLATWLALLSEDPHSAGMLGAILERADAIAIQRDIHEYLIKNTSTGGARAGRVSTFIDSTPESSGEKEHLLGAEFIKWLTQELKKGLICINKIPLVVIPTGLIMSREVFQLFMKNHPEVKHWQAVQKGLISWGLHRTNADGHAISQIEDPKTQKTHEGILLENYSVVLPDEVQFHHPDTGKESTVSAIQVAQLQQSDNPAPLSRLSLSGKWELANINSASLQSGYTRRE